MTEKFKINSVDFVLSLTLEQDELLGIVIHEMLTECPEIAEASQGMLKAAQDGGGDKGQLIVKIAFDMAKAHAWIYKKGYARKILAVLLVPEGKEFQLADVPDREVFMGKHATREIANEVINFFFARSGAFGIATQAYSQKPD